MSAAPYYIPIHFTKVGPAYGPLHHSAAPEAIAILDAEKGGSPIGAAALIGRDGGGVALYRLAIKGAALPGRWIVISRRLCPTE